jgi:hypothetical protein
MTSHAIGMYTLPFIAAATACLSACSQDALVRFQHVSHAGQGLRCNHCHAGIERATTAGEKHIPGADKCSTCHPAPHRGVVKPGPCAGCHSAVHRDRHESPLVFSHASHIERGKGQCFPCHNAITIRTPGAHRLIPTMATCLTCHQNKWDGLECNYCHAHLQLFPIKPVSQFAHNGDFLRAHGRLASSRADLCSQCHTQSYCAACHDPKKAGVLKPSIRFPDAVDKAFIHRGDYVGRHAIEARSAGDSCVRCHQPNECASCHASRGVMQGSGRSPHPAGWVSVTGGPNLHGRAARREAISCAGCHDKGAASNCVTCHRVGGVGGNPHPPGWRTRQSKSDRVCRICH